MILFIFKSKDLVNISVFISILIFRVIFWY